MQCLVLWHGNSKSQADNKNVTCVCTEVLCLFRKRKIPAIIVMCLTMEPFLFKFGFQILWIYHAFTRYFPNFQPYKDKKKLWKSLVKFCTKNKTKNDLKGFSLLAKLLLEIRWQFKLIFYLINNYYSSQMAKFFILKDTFTEDKTVISGFLILANGKLTMDR